MFRITVLSCAIALCAGSASAQSTVILENFSGGVIYTKQNPGSNPNPASWYEIGNDGGKTMAAADTLDGSPAMRVYIRGNGNEGGRNGLYRVFNNSVPTTGSWHVNAKIRIRESAVPMFTNGPTGLNTVHNLQMGVLLNGAHRGNRDLNSVLPVFAQVPTGYLTSADDSAKPTISLRTTNFTAGPADKLLIGFSTDVLSGTFEQNSNSTWNRTDYLVDEIILEDASLPVSMSSWTLE